MTGETDLTHPSGLDACIARVRAVLHTWVKGTTIDQMRRQWDELYFSDELPAKEAAVEVGGVPATWFTATGAREGRVPFVPSWRRLQPRFSALAPRSRGPALASRQLPRPRRRVPPRPPNIASPRRTTIASRPTKRSSPAASPRRSSRSLVIRPEAVWSSPPLIAARDRKLPLASAGVLLSAFTDLTVSRPSYESRADVDPMDKKASIQLVARAYLKGAGDDAARDPRASPIFADLHGLPPLLVQVGDREIVLDDSLDFAAAARAAGVDVTLEVHERMIHVFQQFAADVPEAAQAVATIGTFLDRHWNQAR